MTPAELTALEAELRYTAAARAMRHSATTPTGYVEYRAADAIAEQIRENADLRRKLDDEEATFDARVQEMSERFRAVNVVEALKQLGPDRLAQIERASAAESELARLKDRVARLCDWIEHEVGVELPFDARGTLTTDNPGGDTAREGGEWFEEKGDLAQLISTIEALK